MPRLTHKRLKEVLSYDASTGIFTWKSKTAKGTEIGSQAGYTDDDRGYRKVHIDREEIFLHRLAWFYVHGQWPRRLSFLNGDRDDCRIANLHDGRPLPGKFDHKTTEGRAAYGRAHRAANPDLYRDHDLRKNFGITLGHYQGLSAAQDGLCAICGRPETEVRNGKVKALAVDHHHGNGKIRGLLCHACNKAIGLMEDDIERIKSAIAYLKKHQKPRAGA